MGTGQSLSNSLYIHRFDPVSFSRITTTKKPTLPVSSHPVSIFLMPPSSCCKKKNSMLAGRKHDMKTKNDRGNPALPLARVTHAFAMTRTVKIFAQTRMKSISDTHGWWTGGVGAVSRDTLNKSSGWARLGSGSRRRRHLPSSGAIDGTCQRPDAPDPGMRPPRGLVQSIPKRLTQIQAQHITPKRQS